MTAGPTARPALVGAGRRALQPVVDRWRRSLALRVVASTLVASAIVVALLGVILLAHVGRGVLTAKTNSALAESNSGLTFAQNQVAATESSDRAAVDRQLEQIVRTLSQRGAPSGLYQV